MPLTSRLHTIGQVLRGYLNDQIEGGGNTDLARRLAFALRGDTDLSGLLEELDDCFRSTKTERPDVAGEIADGPSALAVESVVAMFTERYLGTRRAAPAETCSNRYEPEKQAAWTSFWWESNAANGLIDSPARWTGLVHAYQEVVFPCVDPAQLPEARRLAVQQMLDRGRLASRPGRPAFGTRAEHSGQTLREWAADRGMSMVDVQG